MITRAFSNILIDDSSNNVSVGIFLSNHTVECGLTYSNIFERVESAEIFANVFGGNTEYEYDDLDVIAGVSHLLVADFFGPLSTLFAYWKR